MDNYDITLIFPSSPFLLNQAVFPPLGIMYLSAYLKHYGLNVQCLDMGIGHTPDMAKSDTIGISVTTPQRFEAYELATYYRKQGRKVIAGGPHATHMADECVAHGFDTAIKGRGEIPLLERFMSIIGSDWSLFPDRDALPIHDYHYEIDGVPATPIMTSRGCPYSCSFCAKIGDNFQMQSSSAVVMEIEHIHNEYGYEAFMIFDDVFIASKDRLRQIVARIGGKYLFRCFARSNLLDDETCILLKWLGVVEVGIGIESGSDRILKRNMKGTTRTMNTNAVQKLHKHGIRAKAFLIVGLPGETRETVFDTANWIEEAQPDDVDVSVFQPLPGSTIFADPKKWDIEFIYDGRPQWYKGTPGQYVSNVATEELSADKIVAYRDILEEKYKRKELLR